MMTAAAQPAPASYFQNDPQNDPASRFQSAMFQFPGRPLPLARRLALYNRVKRILRGYMDDQKYNEVPAPAAGIAAYLGRMIDRGFPAVWSECQIEGGEGGPAGETRQEMIGVMGADRDEESLLLLQMSLLENVVRNLSANLLGGRQITRLDRVLTCGHRRLSYTEACAILDEHGHPVEPGESIGPEKQAALSRLCHNMPLQITDLPEAMAAQGLLANVAPGQAPRYHGILLPYSGLTMIGCEIPAAVEGRFPRGGFTLNLGRLLQFLMGLESVLDTVISPSHGMSRV